MTHLLRTKINTGLVLAHFFKKKPPTFHSKKLGQKLTKAKNMFYNRMP